MGLLSLQTYSEPGSVRLALSGELDIASALMFDDELRRIEDEQDPPEVVLDLRSLKFMDSTGLRLILRAHARALKRGHRLAIVQGGEAVKRIFKLTGVGERLNIVDDAASYQP